MSKKIKEKYKKSKETSETRRDFYKRLLYIALCILPIIIFANNKGSFRLVPLPFFLIGMYQLIQIIALSQFIIDDFFPPKVFYETKTKPFDNFIYYFSAILFFVGLVGFIFEIKNYDNTINGSKLFWTACFIGIGVAIFLTIILKLTRPSVYYESKRRLTVHLGLFLGLFLVSTALTGFINHYFADPTIFCEKYCVESKGKSERKRRYSEYYFHIKTDKNKEERFSVNKALYDNLKEGEEVELCMVKGRFGFYYVKNFNKVGW